MVDKAGLCKLRMSASLLLISIPMKCKILSKHRILLLVILFSRNIFTIFFIGFNIFTLDCLMLQKYHSKNTPLYTNMLLKIVWVKGIRLEMENSTNKYVFQTFYKKWEL